METGNVLEFNEKKTICYRTLLMDFLIVNVAAGVAILFTLFFMLLQHYHVLPSFPCVIHEIFNVYCPGCGGTRALFSLLSGNIVQSLYYNPALVLGLLLILYYEVGVIITLIKKNGKRYYFQKGWMIYGYIILVAVFTVVRDYLLVRSGIDMLGDFL